LCFETFDRVYFSVRLGLLAARTICHHSAALNDVCSKADCKPHTIVRPEPRLCEAQALLVSEHSNKEYQKLGAYRTVQCRGKLHSMRALLLPCCRCHCI
jgi:hypothetical protein